MVVGGVYVAATRQHVGKTSSSLGLVHGLQKIFKDVGFIKPMGQEHVEHTRADGSTALIDKDCPLFRELLGCSGALEDTSPLVVPRGYTKAYVDMDAGGRAATTAAELTKIRAAYERIAADSDFVVAEGTGHSAVGSILGLNNATLARALGLPMVLVVNGGVGSSYDEFALNRSLIERTGATLAGVLVNKVNPAKVDVVTEYLGKLLEAEDVPLLGVVPDREFFASPTIADYLRLFKTDLLVGDAASKRRHFSNVRLATSSTAHFLRAFPNSPPDTVWVAHQTRADLMLALAAAASEWERATGEPYPGALILTGVPRPDYPEGMHPDIKEYVAHAAQFPILYAPASSHEVMGKLDRFTSKLNVDDEDRARMVCDHYAKHVDFDLLLQQVDKNAQDAL